MMNFNKENVESRDPWTTTARRRVEKVVNSRTGHNRKMAVHGSQVESGDSLSSGYWSQRNKLPIQLIPKSRARLNPNQSTRKIEKIEKIEFLKFFCSFIQSRLSIREENRQSRTVDRNSNRKNRSRKSRSVSPEYRHAIYEINFENSDENSDKSVRKKTIGKTQKSRDNRELTYLTKRLTKILLTQNPVNSRVQINCNLLKSNALNR